MSFVEESPAVFECVRSVVSVQPIHVQDNQSPPRSGLLDLWVSGSKKLAPGLISPTTGFSVDWRGLGGAVREKFSTGSKQAKVGGPAPFSFSKISASF